LVKPEQALRCDLFCLNHTSYQDKDTCAIRLGFGHLNEEEEIIVKKLKQAYDSIKKPNSYVRLSLYINYSSLLKITLLSFISKFQRNC
jgi:hypothetical protein